MDQLHIDWGHFGAVLSGIGALGIAAFGVTEALGKAFAWSTLGPGGGHHFGLPYVGLSVVTKMLVPLRPALKRAYGEDFLRIIAQQYRSDRSSGRAPDTIRQGVRLGLPFLPESEAAKLIGAIWDMDPVHSLNLARSLMAETPSSSNGEDAAPADAPSTSQPSAAASTEQMQALAGRFATALDARVNAAFALAEERYQAQAKLISGVVAVALAYAFEAGAKMKLGPVTPGLVGLVAVPLAPVAKDLSSSLQDALTAFKSIPTRKV